MNFGCYKLKNERPSLESMCNVSSTILIDVSAFVASFSDSVSTEDQDKRFFIDRDFLVNVADSVFWRELRSINLARFKDFR
jgi:hypothetical protein